VPYPATVDLLPKTLLGRVCAALAAVAIIVVAVFFLTVALAIAGVAFAVAVVRVMWLAHKTRRHGPPRADDEAIEVEYTVVEEREAPDQPTRKP
jgi:membrane protein implicated in regulation of membrane protease activity